MNEFMKTPYASWLATGGYFLIIAVVLPWLLPDWFVIVPLALAVLVIAYLMMSYGFTGYFQDDRPYKNVGGAFINACSAIALGIMGYYWLAVFFGVVSAIALYPVIEKYRHSLVNVEAD